jgi:hypothetical protein
MRRVFFATKSNRKRYDGFAFLYSLLCNFLGIVLYVRTFVGFNVAFILGQGGNL